MRHADSFPKFCLLTKNGRKPCLQSEPGRAVLPSTEFHRRRSRHRPLTVISTRRPDRCQPAIRWHSKLGGLSVFVTSIRGYIAGTLEQWVDQVRNIGDSID